MNQNIRETIHREYQEQAESAGALPLEIANAEGVPPFTDACAKMLEAIAHDETVTTRDLLALEEAIRSWRFDAGKGAPVSIGELSEAFKEQAAVWKTIEQTTVQEFKDMGWEYTKIVLKLTNLPKKVAKKLSAAGRYMLLGNVISLSDQAAEGLADHRSPLYLPKLAAASDKAIESLSRHSDFLEIGLTDLSITQARLLSKHEGALQLLKLGEISDEALAELAAHRGSLTLNLDTLSDAGVRILAGYQGNLLSVSLNTWTDEVVEALSAYEGSLELRGLNYLTKRGTAALIGHKGHFALPSLENISDEAAYLLAQYKGDVIEGLSPEITAKIEAVRQRLLGNDTF